MAFLFTIVSHLLAFLLATWKLSVVSHLLAMEIGHCIRSFIKWHFSYLL